MRILFVLPRMVSGGVERVTLNLIDQFKREGIECRLALRRSCGELNDEARMLVPIDELAPRGMYQFVPALCRVLSRWRPTHVVTAFADIGILTWVAMRLAKSRARWIHGAHNIHVSITGPSFWAGLRDRIDNSLSSFVYRHADHVVAVSEGLRTEMLTQFALNPTRVTTIYNPVIYEAAIKLVPEPRRSIHHPLRIVSIGRLVREKGFDLLIMAMARVREPCRLDIWGEGPERSHLESLLSQYDLQSVIHLRGYTSEPLKALSQADLFVLPSRREGFCNVLVEALACGVPVVASDCPYGPREILEDGHFGVLVPPENVSAIASAIRNFARVGHTVSAETLISRAKYFSVELSRDRWLALLLRH